MRKLWLFVLSFLLMCNSAFADDMNKLIKKINYLNETINIVGLPDFPPFSYYDPKLGILGWTGAFVKPMINAMQELNIKNEFGIVSSGEMPSVKMLLIEVRAGTYQLFIGANSDTKLYKGLELIYPSIISNPIHVITLPDKQANLKSYNDLKNYRGVASREEYFSDFVLRKLKEANVKFVDTSYEAYEKLFTDEADFMIGGLYYNKIMSSRYGLERYLAFSRKPLYKTPIFLALSKVMPKLSEYQKAFQQIFSSPEFANAVKQEIIRIVDDELTKNDGIVPPSFAKDVSDGTSNTQISVEETNNNIENNMNSGHIIEEREAPKKTFDEVLKGL